MATRVSVIDDDADLIDLFQDMLAAEGGFEVLTYHDALPGIEDLIASRPDLIIVDLALAPEREQLSGGQVIHSARTSEALRDVPIVVVSTDTDAMRAAWPAFEARGDIHRLAKPFSLADFQRVLATALGRSQHGPVLARTGGRGSTERRD